MTLPSPSKAPSPRSASSQNVSSKAALASVYGVVVVDLIGFGIVVPILPFYAESYGASATVLGLLLTCYAAMQLVFAPIWGRLSDRVGRRPVMLSTVAGTALALLVLGLAPSLLWLFAARLLAGIFGANVSVASAYITDVTAEDERAKYMGLLGASFGVGFILGPAIGGLLAPFGYGVPMLVAAALAAINFFVALVTLREPAPEAGTEREPAPTGRPQRLPRDPVVRRLCLANFLFVVGVSQLETVFAFFMMDLYGWDARQVAMILVLMAVVMIALQGGGIRPLVARHGERAIWLVGLALLAPSLALVPHTPSIAWLLVPLLVSSAGRALVHPTMLSIVSQAASASERGLVMGAYQSAASLARIVGPLAAGVLYDLRIPLPFWLAGLLTVAVAGLALGLPSSGE
ncbi:MAG: MFS transporter [Acidobacteriota bacterium]